MTILTSTGGQQQQPLSRKVCATAAECISGSINLGTDKLVLQSQCCGTDLCNNQTVSALTFLPPNGKTCFTCSGNDCTDGVSCEGDADQCIGFTDTAAGAQATLNGCMSNSLRSAAAMILQALKVSGSVSYCNGDLCTSPASVSNAAPVKHKRAKRDTNVPSTVGVTQSTQTVSNSTTVGGNNTQSVNSSTTVGGNNTQSVNSSSTVGGNNAAGVKPTQAPIHVNNRTGGVSLSLLIMLVPLLSSMLFL
ncbi:hypothetical protein NFI96_018196 [Prochilodus magdalenae]|nr:hypothetical protein NFI96_018196 [Prochilodus magdalenae]